MATITNDSRATIRTSMGNLTLEFIGDKAPRTVDNFLTLAHRGFYEGLTFHRVIKDFMIQGGCPKGNGSGGPGHTIRPEFNDTPHVKGTVSMARSSDPNSAGSQFFICLADARYLDSRYTAFARVVDGVDVLDKIAAVPTQQESRFKENSVPRDPVYINAIELENVEFDEEEPPPPKAAQASEPTATEDADAATSPKEKEEESPKDAKGEDAPKSRGRNRSPRNEASVEAGGDEAAPENGEGGGEPAEKRGKPRGRRTTGRKTARSKSRKPNKAPSKSSTKAPTESKDQE